MIKMRVRAADMLPGDHVGSGETVIGVSAGARTPAGKLDVILERSGKRRAASWRARTEINVTRMDLKNAPV